MQSSKKPRTFANAFVTIVAALLAYLATAGLLLRVAAGWQIPLFVGAVAGLAASSILLAALCGSGTLLAAAAVYPPWFAEMSHRSLSAVELLQFAAVSAVAAVAVSALRFRSPLSTKAANNSAAVVLLVMVLVNSWITPMIVDSLPVAQNGTGLVSDLRNLPQPGACNSDADVHIRIIRLMHDGMPYYDAVRDAWANAQTGNALPLGIVSYRLPTLIWLWSMLPRGPAIIPVFLCFVSVAIVAAFSVPAQLGLVRLAPVAAALVAGTYLVPAVSTYITYVDPWAMALALAGFAALLRAEKKDSITWRWTSVGLLIAAALVREILVYVPVFAAVASFSALSGASVQSCPPLACGTRRLRGGVCCTRGGHRRPICARRLPWGMGPRQRLRTLVNSQVRADACSRYSLGVPRGLGARMPRGGGRQQAGARTRLWSRRGLLHDHSGDGDDGPRQPWSQPQQRDDQLLGNVVHPVQPSAGTGGDPGAEAQVNQLAAQSVSTDPPTPHGSSFRTRHDVRVAPTAR